MALLSQRRTAFLSGLAVIVLTLILIILDSHIRNGGSLGIVHHQFSFTKGQALEVLSAWGPTGQSLFLKTIWLDYLYPLFYALFLSSLMAVILAPQLKQYTGLSISLALMAPFMAAFFDIVENTYQIVQVQDGAGLPGWVFFMTSLTAVIKWFFILSSVGLIFYFKYAKKRRIIKVGN